MIGGRILSISRLARLMIRIDPVGGRRDLAAYSGADVVVDPSTEFHWLLDCVRDLCRPDGVDAVIEVTGVPQFIPLRLELSRTGGRFILAGVVNPDAAVMIDANQILRHCLTLSEVHNYHPRHLLQALNFVVPKR